MAGIVLTQGFLPGRANKDNTLPCQHVAVGLHVHERQRSERRWDAPCTMQSSVTQALPFDSG